MVSPELRAELRPWLLSGQDKCSKRLLSGRNRKGGSEIKKAGNHSRRIDVGFLK
jgi:hypothetical protein